MSTNALVARRVSLLLVFVAAFAAISCGGGGPPPAAPSPPSGSLAAWLVATLGAASDASVTIRPQAARTDPYWGPLFGRVLARP